MKYFSITCTINGKPQQLHIMQKQTSFSYFFIYKDNCWIGTMQKYLGKQYQLTSYSEVFLSIDDVKAIGQQLDFFTSLGLSGSSATASLQAA